MSNGTAIQPVQTGDIKAKKSLSIVDLIQESTKELQRALPAHMNAERIARIALTTLRMNPKLMECDPYTFIGALFQSAQLGLEPNTIGEAWIIPYKSKNMPKPVAQFQVGAEGWRKLFWNHPNSVSLSINTVCERDVFEYDLATCEVKHKLPQFGADRGQAVGYYAYAQLTNGGRSLKVLSRSDAEKHAQKFSKCWDRKENRFIPGTPWADHFNAMAEKTVTIMLIKTLPKSVEIQRALSADETVKVAAAGVNDMLEAPNLVPYEELRSLSEASAGEPEIGVKETEVHLAALEIASTKPQIKAILDAATKDLDTGTITIAQFEAIVKKADLIEQKTIQTVDTSKVTK